MRELQTILSRNRVVRDRYVIEELLGQGGFGAVYRVRDRRVKGNVFALKEINNPNRHRRESFLFEGELLKRLDHPALPRVYRVFDDHKCDRICMLMDYIEGPNLERLRLQQPEKRFTLAQVLHMLEPICKALVYLHEQQPPIIHRDIKPSNMIIPPSGEDSVLVDFGIAKEYEEDSTTTAVRHCSPGYGAPEQYINGTSTQTDVYGFGATIYTLLTGTVPIDALYRVTRLSVKRDDPLQRASELVPVISEPIADALERALSINSADRFATVQEFWQTLQACLVESPSTDPVADLRSSSVLTVKDMTAALSPSPVFASDVVAPEVVATPVMAMVAPETPAYFAKLVYTPVVTNDTLSDPSVPVSEIRLSRRLHHDAYKVLTLALLLLIIALSSGAYMYAGAQKSADRPTLKLATIPASVHTQQSAAVTATTKAVTAHKAALAQSRQQKTTGIIPQIQQTAVPESTATPTVGLSPTVVSPTQLPQSPVPSGLPVLASTYSGTIHNTPADVEGSVVLSHIQQSQSSISGYLTLGGSLLGDGSFTGTVTEQENISFLVASSGVLPLFFQGHIQADGSMSGSYCSYRNNHCDYQAGGYGTWSVSPQ
jgi:serine/threonine protein kinase